LLVATGLANTNAVVLREPFEQLDTLLEHSVPGVVTGILKTEFATGRPFAIQGSRGVFATEEGGQSLFERATE